MKGILKYRHKYEITVTKCSHPSMKHMGRRWGLSRMYATPDAGTKACPAKGMQIRGLAAIQSMARGVAEGVGPGEGANSRAAWSMASATLRFGTSLVSFGTGLPVFGLLPWVSRYFSRASLCTPSSNHKLVKGCALKSARQGAQLTSAGGKPKMEDKWMPNVPHKNASVSDALGCRRQYLQFEIGRVCLKTLSPSPYTLSKKHNTPSGNI